MSCLPFSLRFYMIMIIFLIFGIEIIILLPLPIITNLSHKSLAFSLLFSLFSFVLYMNEMKE